MSLQDVVNSVTALLRSTGEVPSPAGLPPVCEELARELAKSIQESHSHLLCGSPTANQRKALERATHPKPGQWVVELSTFGMKRGPVLGRLITSTVEEHDNPEWVVARDGPRPRYRYWYIEHCDGRLARWWNCCFITTAAEPLRDEHDVDNMLWAREAMKRHDLPGEPEAPPNGGYD